MNRGKVLKCSMRRRWETVGLAALSGMALNTPFAALAQNAPLPPKVDTITRDEIEANRAETPAKPQQVSVDSRRAVEQGACPLLESNVMVDITTIRFEGGGDEPVPAEFLPLLAKVRPATQGQQRIAAVCDMRDQANAVLRAAGYIAGVQIPAQEITNGELRLQVIAGRITDVTVSGDPRHYRDSITARIEQLKSLYPLNEKDAERILLIAGDVPGLDVSLALRSANTKPGELVGELNIDTISGTLLANVQNTGSRQLGRELATLRGELYGLTGAADLTYLSVSNSLQFDEQHVVQLGHEMGIGSSGIRFGLRGSYAQSQPDIPNLSLKTRSYIVGVDLKAPLVRQVAKSLSASLGVEYTNQRTLIGGSNGSFPFTQDRTTVAYARLDGALRAPRSDGDNDWILDGTIELRKGLDILKATPLRTFVNGFSPSRFDGDSKATVARGDIHGSLRVAKGAWLTGSALGQWSNHALLNLEEFSIGNLTYGRGYNPGANGGDRIIAYRIEPRARLVDTDKWRFEISAFYDNVRLWNLDTSTIETKRTLDSVGGGARIVFNRRIILDVTYAKPLKLALATDQRRPTDRILFSLTTKILPWR
jgi:hemolysin activation/secretion protein